MIYLIRHAKVLHKWPKYTSSSEFSEHVAQYDQAAIEQIQDHIISKINSIIPERFDLFTSQLSRTIDTKNQLFNCKNAVELSQLNEIPLVPYKHSVKSVRTWRCFLFCRITWGLNASKRRMVLHQFDQIYELISRPEHSVIVGHGFSFMCLLHYLERKGYNITKNRGFIKNLDVIICDNDK